jgi:hypothetical protein
MPHVYISRRQDDFRLRVSVHQFSGEMYRRDVADRLAVAKQRIPLATGQRHEACLCSGMCATTVHRPRDSESM